MGAVRKDRVDIGLRHRHPGSWLHGRGKTFQSRTGGSEVDAGERKS